MNIIGISGLHHSVAFKKREFPEFSAREHRIVQGFDAAAALVTDAGVGAVAAEERFTRRKATGAFPVHAIRYCLEAGGLAPGDIDALAHGFSYEPYRDYYQHDEFSRRQFDEVYSVDAQRRCIEEHLPGEGWAEKLVPVSHHLAHAASAFYPSGFEEALILVTDGMGEVDSATVAVGRGHEIEVLATVPALHSLGVLYGIFTLHLGFFMSLDEYKVMGLAPYGDPRKHFDAVMSFIRLKDDGTYAIPLLSEDKTLEEKESHRGVLRVLADTFGPTRSPESEVGQEHMDLAAGLQAALQATLMHTLRTFKRQTGLRQLCLAGGVALNCTANGVIKRSRLFRQMFVQPAAGDDGSSLGAALQVQHERGAGPAPTRMDMPVWGPRFDDDQIRAVLDQRDEVRHTHYDSFETLADEVARRIADGQIVASFQDGMEFGPRALGNRSILADPREPGMRDLINELVKKREGFRPFAPAVTKEAASTYFEVTPGDEDVYEHMLFVLPVQEAYRDQLPAITHVDGSARVQTVDRTRSPRFWALLDAFGRLTGMPVLLNTSFNVRAQPIVCTPSEAVDTFFTARLHAMVIGNFLVVRKDAA